MTVESLRLSDLAGLSDSELDARLSQLGAAEHRGFNGEVEYVDSRIARLESRYEMSSAHMLGEVKAGRLLETAEIGHWLMLLEMRARLGQRRF